MATGDLVWKYKGPDKTLLWPGMPSVADGKVYVTTGEIAEYNGHVGDSRVRMFKRLHWHGHLDTSYRSIAS